MQPSEEIKSRLDIVEVIREYVPLKPAGVNFKAKCPFHNEKTPSFIVSPEKQIWHCFGCGKGGDIFSFIMEIEGISFVEALRLLAKKAGVVLRRTSDWQTSKRNRLLDILDLSARFYHQVLLKSSQASWARNYLKNRGLSQETISNWQIGFSPDSWDNLLNFLKKRGYKQEEIFAAGLTIKKEKGQGYYDRFRDRIMFPITDINGNVVGFSARINPKKEEAEKLGKYINTPQTVVYDKSKILFGLDKAKLSIKQKDLAVVVEGQMDVISAHQAGFTNTIASSGTALGADQIRLISRFSKNIALAFDQDTAGLLALERASAAALLAGLNVLVIKIPTGKDPDECIRQDPKQWERAVAEPEPLLAYFFNQVLSSANLSQPAQRQQAVDKLLSIIALIGNSLDQDYWLKQLSQRVDVNEALLREELKKVIDKQNKQSTTATKTGQAPLNAVNQPLSRAEKQSARLLALLFAVPTILQSVINDLNVDCLEGQTHKALYKQLVLYYNNKGRQTIEANQGTNEFFVEFNQWLKDYLSARQIKETKKESWADQHLSKIFAQLVLLGESEFYEYNADQAWQEARALIRYLKQNYYDQRLKELEKLISQAEKRSAIDEQAKIELAALLEEFKILSEEKRSLEL